MSRYSVYASITCVGWVTVEAESPEEAEALAYDTDGSDFEVDRMTAQVEFDITPMIEVES
jgi:hypothetical protein